MLKLIKPLKPFIWLILVIFILLYAQAMADLSLPGYMADIVNIGIQQNGIDNAVPQAIEAVESHRFDVVKRLYWRNRDLDMSSFSPIPIAPRPRPPVIPSCASVSMKRTYPFP